MDNPENYNPDMRDQFVRDVAEHEVLLSFNSDEHAYAFNDWWLMKGSQQFVDWVRDERHPEHRN